MTIHYAHLLSNFLTDGYELIENKICERTYFGEYYGTLMDTKAACSSNNDCFGFYTDGYSMFRFCSFPNAVISPEKKAEGSIEEKRFLYRKVSTPGI